MSMQNIDLLRPVRAFMLDLDGTLYLGDRLFDWTLGFLDVLRQRGLGRIFMTNNSSRDAESYVQKLRRLGISDAEPQQVITSGQSAMLYLADHPELQRIYVLGTPALEAEVRAAGRLALTDQPETADAVLVGYDTTLTFERLSGAAIALEQGAGFLATHPDRGCPDPRGMLPDCGALCACLENVTGRRVDQVFGKPSQWMLHLATERTGLLPQQMALVGDRLYTDIAMAVQSGMPSVLVLSGETRRSDVADAVVQPDMVFDDVGALGRALTELS